MGILKTFALGATILLAAANLVNATDTEFDCRSVDATTFAATRPASIEDAMVGPKGLYHFNTKYCTFYDLTNEANAKAEPGLNEIYTNALSNLSAKRSLEKRQRPGCGQICQQGGNNSCLYPCSCQYSYVSCNQNICYTVYVCQS